MGRKVHPYGFRVGVTRTGVEVVSERHYAELVHGGPRMRKGSEDVPDARVAIHRRPQRQSNHDDLKTANRHRDRARGRKEMLRTRSERDREARR